MPEKLKLDVIDIGKDGKTIDDVLVHDETNKLMAQLLASLKSRNFPTAIGVLYCEPGPTYDDEVKKQLEAEIGGKSDADFNEILKSGSSAARQIKRFEETGKIEDGVAMLIEETMLGCG